MADGRMLRRKIALDKGLAQLSSDRARLCFTWCIPFLDVDGRMTGDLDVVKAMVFPMLKTFTTETIEQDIAECHRIGLVVSYCVDGDPYLVFPGFPKNQRIRRDREANSGIPPPPQADTTGVGHQACRSTPGVLLDDAGSTPTQVRLREEKLSSEPGSASNGASTWLTPYADAWRETMGGQIQTGKAVAHLAKAHKETTADGEVDRFVAAFRAYLLMHTGEQARFIDFAKFASTWRQYEPNRSTPSAERPFVC